MLQRPVLIRLHASQQRKARALCVGRVRMDLSEVASSYSRPVGLFLCPQDPKKWLLKEKM